MSEYRIFETEQFSRDLDLIAKAGRTKVLERLRRVAYPQLASHPHFGAHIRKLKAYEPETWRHRIGAWRFFYQIDEDERIVFMIAAQHRGSAY